MASRNLAFLIQQSRAFSNTPALRKKVTVVGAAGGIGQPLSLLLKTEPLITSLSLFDVAPVTPGVAADLSHMPLGGKVVGFTGTDGLAKALEGTEVVIVPAGVPRKPGMTRDDLFNTNAGIVANIVETFAKVSPKAALLIISNPVNSTVPIAAEILKKHGVYNPRKLFGVTYLDVIRAQTFIAENQGWKDASSIKIPVVGGHAGITILPLLSQLKNAKFSEKDKEALTKRIMFGGDEVVQAKGGGGSATLSMAYAGYVFARQVIRALNGEKGITECTYVESKIVKDVPFFSSPVTLGPNGIEKIQECGPMDDFEKKKFEEMLKDLRDQIAKGVEFAKNFGAKKA